ncbi:MAG: CubicO group peptidase (beta-lactamase class C family) [Polaribacter sp.]|jgi:CubicO group peptidase (beta-lactamase class C family)
MKFLSLTVTLFLSQFIYSQPTTTFEWPNNEITPIFKEFVVTFNKNDSKNMNTFTKRHYENDPEKIATYWLSVYAEYGHIKPFKLDEDWTKENRLAIWFQGIHTKDWVMIVLKMNTEDTKIIGKTVVRGLRPKGVLPPYTSISSDKVNPYLTNYLEKLNNLDRFSGSVLVAKGNTILFNQTYGKSNIENNKNNDETTSFNIASTTKVFTAVAIAKLAEQGKLNFTDPISKFIPEYPKDIADQVTIHHLLTHTSGIELDDYIPFNEDVSRATSMEGLLNAQLKHIDSLNEHRRKEFKVLDTYDYSNENFALLGVIIERASKSSYANYLEDSILTPLKMKNTYADISKIKSNNNIAFGYTNKNIEGEFVDGKKRRRSAKMIPNYIDPFGGIYSNSKDLYTFFKAINNKKIISEEFQNILQKKHVKIFEWNEEIQYYGYGFNITKKGQIETMGHSGVVSGTGSRFEYYSNQDYYVIVLSNYGSMAGNVVANHIRDVIDSNNK